MTVEAALTKEQIKMYDVAAHTWYDKVNEKNMMQELQ